MNHHFRCSVGCKRGLNLYLMVKVTFKLLLWIRTWIFIRMMFESKLPVRFLYLCHIGGGCNSKCIIQFSIDHHFLVLTPIYKHKASSKRPFRNAKNQYGTTFSAQRMRKKGFVKVERWKSLGFRAFSLLVRISVCVWVCSCDSHWPNCSTVKISFHTLLVNKRIVFSADSGSITAMWLGVTGA